MLSFREQKLIDDVVGHATRVTVLTDLFFCLFSACFCSLHSYKDWNESI